MSNNLLYFHKTSCSECGHDIKGDPGRTICDSCIQAAGEEAMMRVREESRFRACKVIEMREVAEVIDINRKEKEQEKKIIQRMVEEANALDW